MASRNIPGMNPPYLAKQQRQQQVHEKTRPLQQTEAKRVKRTRLSVALGSSFAVILVVAAVAFITWSDMKKEEMKPGVSPSANVSADDVIFVGRGSSEGATQAGAKNADKPEVRIYSDYTCTYCNDFKREHGNKLVNSAGKGEVAFEIVPLSVLQQEFSDVVSQVDYYIAEKTPQYYAAFHTKYSTDVSALIFARRKSISLESQHKKVALDVAKKVGVPDNVFKGLNNVLNESHHASFLQHAARKFTDAGHQDTPTITINGKRLEDWAGGELLTGLEKVAGYELEASDAEPTTPKG